MRTSARYVFLFSAFLLCALPPKFSNGQSITNFTNFLNGSNTKGEIRLPIGIALAAGDIFVYDEGDPSAIVQFLQSGEFLNWVATPPSSPPLPQDGHLTRDPRTGWIIGLKADGILFAVDHHLNEAVFGNIKLNHWDTSNIYDINLGRPNANLATLIKAFKNQGVSGLFGAIYAVLVNNTTELWISGQSGATSFIMEVPLDLMNGILLDFPKVIIGSVAGSCFTTGTVCQNEPRGIAVNANGQVLTTLPIIEPAGNTVDHVVTFPENFIAGASTSVANPRILFRHQDIFSVSIATDKAGNFYISTGQIGSSLCGTGGSGGIVIIPNTLGSRTCFSPGLLLGALVKDIVVNGPGTLGFLVWGGNNEIIRFSITP